MQQLPPFVVFPAAVPPFRYAQELDAWGRGAKNARARAFYDAKDAERFARRSGIGATIHEAADGFPKIAYIAAASAHRKGVVTEVTWEGGRYL